MIVVKPTVFTTKLMPEIYSLFPYLDGIWLNHSSQCTLTSWMDSKHLPTSQHYEGLAIDLRSRDLVIPTKKEIFDILNQELPEYLVLLEKEGSPDEHFHIQVRR